MVIADYDVLHGWIQPEDFWMFVKNHLYGSLECAVNLSFSITFNAYSNFIFVCTQTTYKSIMHCESEFVACKLSFAKIISFRGCGGFAGCCCGGSSAGSFFTCGLACSLAQCSRAGNSHAQYHCHGKNCRKDLLKHFFSS